MIHFIPDSPESAEPAQGPYGDAVARLASIRQALTCIEQYSGSEPVESMAEAKLAAGWPEAAASVQRCYEARSARSAAAAAAGLEAIAALKDNDGAPHEAAVARLRRELARGVEDIDRLFSL